MTLYKAKIREDMPIDRQFYGIQFYSKHRGKIVYLNDDKGSYLNMEEGGESKYKGHKPCENNSNMYYWTDTCFEWVEEI
jgi:hypothetical protein